MKRINLAILHPRIFEITSDPITVEVDEAADVVQVIAAADLHFALMTKGFFPIENISSLLQLVWDVKNWNFFEDVGIDARDAAQNWIPLRLDPTASLPTGATVTLNPDAGC